MLVLVEKKVLLPTRAMDLLQNVAYGGGLCC
jgi:hypothetical protein